MEIKQFVRICLLATIVLGLWGFPSVRTTQVSSIELIQGKLDQSALQQMIPFFIAGVFIYIFVLNLLRKKTIRIEYIKGLGYIYMGFGCFALFSMLISYFPLYTAYKASIFLISFGIIFIYFSYYSIKWYDLFLLVIIYNFIVAINNILFFFIDPKSVSMGNRLIGGMFFNPDFGGTGALLLLLGYTMLIFLNLNSFKKIILSSVIFGAGLILVYLSRTRSVMCVSIGQILVITAIAAVWSKKTARPFSFLILFALVFWFWWDDALNVLTRQGYSLESLSGRTLIWQYYLSYFMESPILGGGYAATSREIARVFVTKTSAHSGWLQILVGTGVVGATIILMLVFVVIKYGLKLLRIATSNRRLSDMERILIITLAISVMHWPLDPPFASDTFSYILNVSIIILSLRASYLHHIISKPVSHR